MDDRRRSPRKPLEADVEYECGSVKATARLANIGRTGIYIATPVALTNGSHLKLRFALPDGRSIVAQARVAHSQTGIGMGIAFVSIKSEDVAHIQEFLEGE